MLESRIDIGGQLAKGRETGRSSHRTAVERPAVAHRTGTPGIEDLHHVCPATERREGISTPDDLAEGRQVGPHAEPSLRAAVPDPERDDLVEDQQRSVAFGE